MLRETISDLNRMRQIAVIAGKYGLGEFLDRSKAAAKSVPEDPHVHGASTARRFRLLLEELGPTFVKLGQIMSTRADLLPSELIEELSTLQDQATPFPFEQVQEQIELAFGTPLNELFDDFDPVPLGAASIAQVHRARTKSGDSVIVKVQRPTVAAQLRSDISALRHVARILEAVVEEFALYRPTGLVDEFESAVQQELNFLLEASNVKAFTAIAYRWPHVRVPRLYEELTNSTVLTLEFLDGTKLSKVELPQELRKQLAGIVLDTAFSQIFDDGLFHGDPHPGNILLLEGNVLGLIDFGLVGRVTPAMRETLVSLALAFSFKDADSVARIIYRLGTPEAQFNLHDFRRDVTALINAAPATLDQYDARHILRSLLNLSVRYRLRIPKDYATLGRAAILTEGLLRSLYPEMNIAEALAPYTKKVLLNRLDFSQLPDSMMKTLLRLQTTATEVPTQLSQILLDLESGKFIVNLNSRQVESLNANIRNLAAILFWGFCACGLTIGVFIAFRDTQLTLFGFPALGVLAILGAIAVSFAATVRLRMHNLKKISLRRWFGSGSKSP